MSLLEATNAIAVLLAVAAAFWQIRLLRREHATEVERNQRSRALEYSLTRAPHLRELRVAIDCVFEPATWGDRTIPMTEVQRVRALATPSHRQQARSAVRPGLAGPVVTPDAPTGRFGQTLGTGT